jgi:hypothetical protein
VLTFVVVAAGIFFSHFFDMISVVVFHMANNALALATQGGVFESQRNWPMPTIGLGFSYN